jgi:DNA-directed RNA polymerase subunit alpha
MQPYTFLCESSKVETPRSLYGCFSLGPLSAGQSLTIGNALRRTLLSELPGFAISAVEIDGVAHEYSTLQGVRDSVLDILLNLKEVVLTSPDLYMTAHSQAHFLLSTSESTVGEHRPWQTPWIGYLQARGPGIVRAADLKLPPGIQCVDPEQYITTLSEDGVFNMKLHIELGKGYRYASSNLKDWSGVEPTSLSQISTDRSSLLLDTVFMPVLKVNYTVEHVSSKTLRQATEMLKMEVWTNGSLHPRQAVYQGLNHLAYLFQDLQKLKILTNPLI